MTLMFIVLLLSSASAQRPEDRGRPAVAVGVLGDTVRSEPTIATETLSRDSIAVVAAASVFLTPEWTVAVEILVPRTAVVHDVGALLGFVGSTTNLEALVRTVSETALLGFRPHQNGRVRFTYLGGLSFHQLRSRLRQVTLTPPSSTFLNADSLQYAKGLTVGVDATVTATEHLSIVPLIRVSSAGRGFSSDEFLTVVRWVSAQWGVRVQWQF